MGGRSRDDGADAPARSILSGYPLLAADMSEYVRYVAMISSVIDGVDGSWCQETQCAASRDMVALDYFPKQGDATNCHCRIRYQEVNVVCLLV